MPTGSTGEAAALDRAMMERALAIAARGRGRTSPNPMVGAVVVKDGAIVGEGYHARAGADHAEVVALAAAGGAARGATLYVTLEPCCHHGRTPPCAERIIATGIARVVVAVQDPNPLVGGGGCARLRGAGIAVEVGLMAAEAARLNEAFFTYITTGRPFVILKAAASLDGRIATRAGESRWITSEAARRRVHELRDEVGAVLVGIGTVLRDDPLLTTRLGTPDQRDPVRVVVDSLARLPPQARVINRSSAAPTLVAVSAEAPRARIEALERLGVRVLVVEGHPGAARQRDAPGSPKRVPLHRLMEALGKLEITSVMIEGGAEINASALSDAIVDKVLLFLAPILVGGRGAPGVVGGEDIERLADAVRLRDVRVEQVGEDILVEGYLRKKA